MTDINKLRKELRFIEDSFKSQILTKEEFLVAKSRIESKLHALEAKEAVLRKQEEERHDALLSAQAPKVEIYYDEAEKLTGKQAPERTPSKPSSVQLPKAKPIQQTEKPKPQASELPPERAKTPLYSYTRRARPPRKFPWRVVVACMLLLVALGLYTFFPAPTTIKIEPVCATDIECQNAGLEGRCVNPGTAAANCTFVEAKPVRITVLETVCPVCDTQRMMNTLKQIYPAATFERMNALDSQGSDLVKTYDIRVLPAYLIDREVEENGRFNLTKSMLKRVNDKYAVTTLASGASYFFTNTPTPGTVELFMKPSDAVSRTALANIQKVAQKRNFEPVIHFIGSTDVNTDTVCVKDESPEKLGAFLSCIDSDSAEECYGKYNINPNSLDCASEKILSDDKERASEFSINTAPVFVFNNQYKKGGSLSLELLDELFCQVNTC